MKEKTVVGVCDDCVYCERGAFGYVYCGRVDLRTYLGHRCIKCVLNKCEIKSGLKEQALKEREK